MVNRINNRYEIEYEWCPLQLKTALFFSDSKYLFPLVLRFQYRSLFRQKVFQEKLKWLMADEARQTLWTSMARIGRERQRQWIPAAKTSPGSPSNLWLKGGPQQLVGTSTTKRPLDQRLKKTQIQLHFSLLSQTSLTWQFRKPYVDKRLFAIFYKLHKRNRYILCLSSVCGINQLFESRFGYWIPLNYVYDNNQHPL